MAAKQIWQQYFALRLVFIVATTLCVPSMSQNSDKRYPKVDSQTPDSAEVCISADLPSLANDWISATNCSAQTYLRQQSPGGVIYGITVSSVKYAYPYYAAWIDVVTEGSACCILRATLNKGQLALLRHQRLERPCCLKQTKCCDVFDGSPCAT